MRQVRAVDSCQLWSVEEQWRIRQGVEPRNCCVTCCPRQASLFRKGRGLHPSRDRLLLKNRAKRHRPCTAASSGRVDPVGVPASAIGPLPSRLSARLKNAVQGCLMFKPAQKVAIFRIVRVSLDRRHDDLPVIDGNSGAKRRGAVGLAHSNTYKQNAQKPTIPRSCSRTT